MSDDKKTTPNINIGETLTAAREERNLSISTAALQCNLDANIIEKLEGNRFSEVGAPVFTRGYLNLYARCLGLDEQMISDAFNKLRASPNPQLHLSEANVASQSKPFKRNYSSKWLLWMFLLLGGALLLLQQLLTSNSWLVTTLDKTFTSKVDADQSNKEQDIVLAVGGKPVNVETTTTETFIPDETLTTEVTPDDPNASATEITTTTTTISDATPDDAAELNLTSLDAANNADSATTTTEPEATPVAAEAPTFTGNTIDLYFKDKSWIQIDDVNKKVVRSGTISKGEKIELPADGAPYSFNIGRPEQVTLTVAGQEKPLKDYQIRKDNSRRFKVDMPNG